MANFMDHIEDSEKNNVSSIRWGDFCLYCSSMRLHLSGISEHARTAKSGAQD